MNIRDLYDPFIERELDAIPPAVERFAAEHGLDEAFSAVSRFAVLAFAPSEHAVHSFLAIDSASALERTVSLITACAIYAAESRLPWSEPPITDPPALSADERYGPKDLERAILQGDRLGAERWLAFTLGSQDFARQFLEAAAGRLGELGHNLIVAVAAARLAAPLPSQARFALFRIPVWAWTANRFAGGIAESADRDRKDLLDDLMNRFFAEKGSLFAFHAIALFDAAVATTSILGDDSIERSVLRRMEKCDAPAAPPVETIGELPATGYRLARDYGEYLKAHAIARRLSAAGLSFDSDAFLRTAAWNLEHSPSFEEWSFA